MGEASEEPWDLVIGQIAAPSGIKGEVRVRPETDHPERFLGLEEVCLEMPSGEQRQERIASAAITPKGIRLRLAGCDSRSAAEQLRGAWIKIRESAAIPLPPESYWVHDILGMKVLTVDGADLGEVIEVIRTAGNDVYVTPKAMIPAVRQVVRCIDLEGRQIVVSLLQEESAGEN